MLGSSAPGSCAPRWDSRRSAARIHSARATSMETAGPIFQGCAAWRVRPRLFASDSSGRSLTLTAGASDEQRGGGSQGASVGGTAAFPESLTTRHVDLGGTLRAQVSSVASVAARVAANMQERTRRFGAQREVEHSGTLFGELTSTAVSGAHTLLAGVAAQFERYRNAAAAPRFDEDRSTPAVFVRHTFTPSAWLATQLNGRCDASNVYGTICTPRLLVLAHSGRTLSARLSGGGGWAGP
jgi:outer membrane receptor for ferrienterochelin and colicins